jgi:hypothetical protein
VAVGVLAVPATVGAHDLFDHPAPNIGSTPLPGGPITAQGPANADWELIATFPTGNPHTDLDFFTRHGETYASVGTLGAGINGGGQTIVRLTRDGKVEENGVFQGDYVSQHPSASCLSNPAAALGLQHDVEAAPKGDTILNTGNAAADRRPTQVILDATDAEGRCHDQADSAGVDPGVPRGGLEIVDVTNPRNPVEIGLTTHIGEAHTVNVDPKRPHIAYAVTSDAVTINSNPDDDIRDGRRENEIRLDNDRYDLDGFEVIDMSSCMNFPRDTSVAVKRMQCRPEVYRYRYPSKRIALGHTQTDGTNALYGCHELEIYPHDRLTCGGGNAAILFDMSNAFRAMGTPGDYSDDKPRGDPLPCRVRGSTSTEPFDTGAKITDCVFGQRRPGSGEMRLSVPAWLHIGAPSLEGVRHVGSAHHQGRGAGGAATPAFDARQDIDFDHEAEFTKSREYILATDERGGGVQPPGATCPQSPGDNPAGNGGLHAYDVDSLDTSYPSSPQDAFGAYARERDGSKAIYRAEVRTGAEATECTAHVFQQIPGQNRIFMGWYSQGTQVVDFIERPDGTFRFKEAGWFIPANANTWVSHVFKARRNGDGTITYWGATGDFLLGDNGRSAIDVYKVTLPAPAQ